MVPPGSDKHSLRVRGGRKRKETNISQVERKIVEIEKCYFLCTHLGKGQRNQFPLRDEESRLAAGKDDDIETQTRLHPFTESLVLFTYERILNLCVSLFHGDIFLFFLSFFF